MGDEKNDVGLRESAKLFAETMAERYFKSEDTENAMLFVVKDGDGISSGIAGYDENLVQALVSAMKNPDVNKIINTSFMLKNGKKLINNLRNNLQK